MAPVVKLCLILGVWTITTWLLVRHVRRDKDGLHNVYGEPEEQLLENLEGLKSFADQAHVDRILVKTALKLHQTCLNHIAHQRNKFPIHQIALLGAGQQVRDAKYVFWGLRRVAKLQGFKVRKSYHDYLIPA